MLSTVTAVPTTDSQRSTKQPAAYKPATTVKQVYVPYDINPVIESPTDEGGGNIIFQGNVEVGGLTAPFSTIWLAQGTRPGYFTNIAQADLTGHYAFIVPVGTGSTVLRLFAENSTDDYSNIDTVTVNRGNPVVAWDAIALTALKVQAVPAPEAARDLAILHAAQYDAVTDATRSGTPYQVSIAAAKGASGGAAADSAAYTVLTSLFPSQAPLFVAAEKSALAGLVPSNSVTAGVNLGQQVADQTLANRAEDGAARVVSLPGSTVPGLWRPTAPAFLPAIDPQFAQVTPFEIAGGSAYRPAAPPGVGTTAYDEALSQVSSLGRVGSTARTANQTAAAYFWNAGAATATVTDPAHWNAIADQASIAGQDTLAKDARLFAQLDFALADSAIAGADSQYSFDEWRPISAVQAVDPTFQPLLTTPSTPSYVSDHAAYANAASTVLTATFGSNHKFTDSTESATVTRSFASFAAAATEDATSRVWGGVNFSFDTLAGANLGTQVGKAVLAKFPRAK